MKRRSSSWIALGILVLVLAAGCGRESSHLVSSSAETSHKIVEEWLVRLEPGSDPSQLAVDFLCVLLAHDPAAEVAVLLGDIDPGALLADARVRALQLNSVVALSEPVEVTHGFHEGDWDDVEIAGQPALTPLELTRAHTVSKGEGMLVAVLDTGVEITHGHLAGRLLLTSEVPPDLGQEESSNGLDDDLDGRIDEAYGHGTHVAGIVLSVAPEATVLPIRIMNDDGMGLGFNLARGLYHAKEIGADIVNLSLSLSSDSEVVHTFLQDLAEAGILVVAAAGNTPGTVQYPATDEYTIGVAATDAQDVLAPFSGSGPVPFAAPGVAVESSFPGNKSAFASGTSMAAPVTSGCLALLWSYSDASSGSEALALLTGFAQPITPPDAVWQGRVAPVSALFRWSPPVVHPTGRKLSPSGHP